MTSAVAHPLTSTEAWELTWMNSPGIRRLDEDDFANLQGKLAELENTDSYLTSPNYYFFTGRKGLWLYETDGAILPISWHPNIIGRLLIFPQIGNSSVNLVEKLLRRITLPSQGACLIRLPLATAFNIGAELTSSTLYDVEPSCELSLDWRYPVHILSTADVAAYTGHSFMYIRNRLRQLRDHKIRAETFDPIHGSRAVERLIHRWAAQNALDPQAYENLYDPYDSLFALSLRPETGLKGLQFIVDGELRGVALWDVSNVKNRTANLFMNLADTTIKGLSEYLIIKSCEALQEQGIAYLNLGGSETAGLNIFKKKFGPAISLELVSAEVIEKQSITSPIHLRLIG